MCTRQFITLDFVDKLDTIFTRFLQSHPTGSKLLKVSALKLPSLSQGATAHCRKKYAPVLFYTVLSLEPPEYSGM